MQLLSVFIIDSVGVFIGLYMVVLFGFLLDDSVKMVW